tara:strand:- start:37941 stop:38615 length:675 start_codon:yes stop_codon:yes gene_type:complete
MELSERTLAVLKNYASINPNIVFNAGNVIKTMAVARNVVSKATVDEEFPKTFGIYDLNEFLNVLQLVKNPNMSFSDNYVTITDGAGLSSIKYYYSDPDMLTVPTKDIVMPDAEVKFTLTKETLAQIKSASSALGHQEISITPSNGSVALSIVDIKDATSNSYSILAAAEYEEGLDFNFVVNVNNIKVVPETFQVEISSKLISNFRSLNSNIEYFIALEKSSTFA